MSRKIYLPTLGVWEDVDDVTLLKDVPRVSSDGALIDPATGGAAGAIVVVVIGQSNGAGALTPAVTIVTFWTLIGLPVSGLMRMPSEETRGTSCSRVTSSTSSHTPSTGR